MEKNISLTDKTVLVTGSAGFIGFHVARHLLDQDIAVVGLDNMNKYYSPQLKQDRTAILQKYDRFSFYEMDLCDYEGLQRIFQGKKIDIICHLAAQAGVRYSIDHPFAYQKSNLEGFTNILEIARKHTVDHLVFASSSSVYGGNTKVPYAVNDPVTLPVSFYAATKVANELMAHSYHHLYSIPVTGLRFFTVYGPWGRPDMAYYSFTKKIVNDEPIKVYNNGDMKRDFTYIDDIVQGVVTSLSRPCGFQLYNLGNHKPVNLLDFISILEDLIGKKAEKEFHPMQPGDMYETYADISKAEEKLGFTPKTDIKTGLCRFIEWYKEYHHIDW